MLPKLLTKVLFMDMMDESGTVFKSTVADINDEHLFIVYPRARMNEFLKRRTQLALMYFDENKNLYESIVTFVGFKKGKVPLMVLERPIVSRKINRRNYFRVPVGVRLKLKISKDVESKEDVTVLSTNLSGGGLAFRCCSKHKLNKDENLSCTVLLPIKKDVIKPLFTEIRVARVEIDPGNPSYQLIGAEFVEIDQYDQMLLVQFCQRVQIEQNKKKKDSN